MVEGGKFLTLSDEAFVDLEIEEEDMGMQTDTCFFLQAMVIIIKSYKLRQSKGGKCLFLL
jgi:hypothetical protein